MGGVALGGVPLDSHLIGHTEPACRPVDEKSREFLRKILAESIRIR